MISHFGVGDKFPEDVVVGRYRKRTTVEMVKMSEPFTCTNREGHNLRGQAGDYLVPDGHGGFYPVSAQFHAENYDEAV